MPSPEAGFGHLLGAPAPKGLEEALLQPQPLPPATFEGFLMGFELSEVVGDGLQWRARRWAHASPHHNQSGRAPSAGLNTRG